MAKIPQIDLGSALPDSGVPRGAPIQDGNPAILSGLSRGVEEAGQLAAREEKYQAQKLRRALEDKQAIVNEVDATRRSGDFEEGLRDQTEDYKQRFADNPQEAFTPYLADARAKADSVISSAPNSEVGLALARKTASSIDGSMTQLHAWAQARMTQKAKNDLSVMVNRVAQGAESQSSPAALAAYLDAKNKELAPIFKNLHGEKASEEMQKMNTEATYANLMVRGRADPLSVTNDLKADSGPYVDNLDAKQRESARSALERMVEGYGNLRRTQIVADGIDQNRAIHSALLDGTLDSGTILASQRANAEKQKATAIDPKLTLNQRQDAIAQLQKQSRFLSAIEELHQRGLPSEVTENSPVVVSLLQRQADLFSKKSGKGAANKDLSVALDFQTDVMVAAKDKQISAATAATMLKSFDLDLPKALKAEANNTWQFNSWYLGWSTSPRQAGNKELNSQFQSGAFKELSSRPDKQNAVRLDYMQHMNDAMKTGLQVDEAAARKMALRALALETGIQIPGVDK